jgi:hypothetical protein
MTCLLSRGKKTVEERHGSAVQRTCKRVVFMQVCPS